MSPAGDAAGSMPASTLDRFSTVHGRIRVSTEARPGFAPDAPPPPPPPRAGGPSPRPRSPGTTSGSRATAAGVSQVPHIQGVRAPGIPMFPLQYPSMYSGPPSTSRTGGGPRQNVPYARRRRLAVRRPAPPEAFRVPHHRSPESSTSLTPPTRPTMMPVRDGAGLRGTRRWATVRFRRRRTGFSAPALP